MLAMELILTLLAILLGVSEGYKDYKNKFNPSVTVKTCGRDQLVVSLENAMEGGQISISGKGPGCKHSISEKSHDYVFRFETCKVNLSKMFRVVVQQRSYVQTNSDKTVQVICAIDTLNYNSNDNDSKKEKGLSGTEGQETSQSQYNAPEDQIEPEGDEEKSSTKNTKSKVSADEVSDSLSTWFKVAMKITADPAVYKLTSSPGYLKYKTTPVTMTTPSTPKTTDVTTSATTKKYATVKFTKATTTTTKPETTTTAKVTTTTPTTTTTKSTTPKYVKTYPTSAPYIMTTSPRTTKVVGAYRHTPPPPTPPPTTTTKHGGSKEIAYDLLQRNNQYKKTLLLIVDFLLKRGYTRSLHAHPPVHKQKSSPMILLYQLNHNHNRKTDHRPYQVSGSHKPMNAIHTILQLFNKSHKRLGDVSTAKIRRHHVNKNFNYLNWLQKHLQIQGQRHANLETNSRLPNRHLNEHLSKSNDKDGHHNEHINKNQHRLGEHQKHVSKLKQGLNHHQELVNKNKHGLGHHQKQENKNKQGLGHHHELLSKLLQRFGHHQEHVNKKVHGHHLENENKLKQDLGHHQKHVQKHTQVLGNHEDHVNKHTHGIGHHQEHFSKLIQGIRNYFKHVNKNTHGHHLENVNKRKHDVRHPQINEHDHGIELMQEHEIGERVNEKHVFKTSNGGSAHDQDHAKAQGSHALTDELKDSSRNTNGATLKSKDLPNVNTSGKQTLFKQLVNWLHGH